MTTEKTKNELSEEEILEAARKADKGNGDKSSETIAGKVPVDLDDQKENKDGTIEAKSKSDNKRQADKTIGEEEILEDDDEEDEVEADDSEEEEIEESLSALETAKAKLMETVKFKINMKEDLGPLLESADLDDEFKSTAVTVFETAVNSATETHIKQIQENAITMFEAAIEQKVADLDEQVDRYTTYAVEQWMEENQIAIESSLVVEKAKAIINGLKELAEEVDVDLSEESVSIYEQSVAKQEELEEGLEQQIESNVKLAEENKALKKTLAVESFVASMVDTKADKIRSLAEELDYEGADAFREKLGVLKENYFPTTGKSDVDMITEDAEGEVTIDSEAKVVQYPHIAAAASLMGKLNRK